MPTRHIPTASGPLWGPASFGRDPLSFLDGARRVHGPRCWIRLGPLRVLLWADAAATDEILRRQASCFEKPALLSRLGAPLFGAALTTQDGAAWQARREALTRALRSLGAEGLARVERGVLEELRSAPAACGVAWLQRGATAGLLRSLLGVRAGPELGGYCDAIARSIELAGDHLAQGIPWPRWSPWGRMARLARLRRLETEQVACWLRDADTSQPLVRALLHAAPYRAAGRRAVLDELNIAIGLGAHQMALALTFALLELLPKRDIVAQVRADRSKARAAVQEALRLHPPFYALVRRARADVRIRDLLIEKGTTVMMSPWLLHRDAALHADPCGFRLDRTEAAPGSYLPYGLGSRACPARALLTATLGGVLQGLLENHALELAPGYEPRHTAKLGLGLEGSVPFRVTSGRWRASEPARRVAP